MGSGPFHCPTCVGDFAKAGVDDVTLDQGVCATVVQGVPPTHANPEEQLRCKKVAAWFKWDGQALWLKDATLERRVVPICARAAIVARAARELGYPGGDRLYQLLKLRMYWRGMRLDCLTICRSQHPSQVEHQAFYRQPKLSPTFKTRGPFSVWCIDLVTKLEPPGARGESICIVAVDPFTKFVLADPLEDKSSVGTMKWLHQRVVCFFGVPLAIRIDQGTEFKGQF
jgi:hypothetical protein